ncbi:MAG: alpha/beta hydrolase-fold protein [Calditrichia bacterium]
MKKIFLVLSLYLLGACETAPSNPTLTIRVQTPSLEEGETVYITGSDSSLGLWEADKVALLQLDNGDWQFKHAYPESTVLEFKLTRGSWNNEAVYDGKTIPGNLKVRVLRDTTLEVSVHTWRDQISIDVIENPEDIVGDVRYHHNIVPEGLLERTVRVWLPPGYDSETQRYPVLYMHDGQNIFSPAFSFNHEEWRVDEVADSLIRANHISPIIVVGVDNTGDRSIEYSTTKKGKMYLRFLTEQLKPMIDETYRTLPDRENTAVMGSSMGGLISFLAIWHHSDVFSVAGCLSPAFIYKGVNSVTQVSNYSGNKKPMRLYIDNGGEGLEKKLQPGCDAMLSALKEIGYDESEVFWKLYPKALHTEKAWAERLHEPLLFMFGQN